MRARKRTVRFRIMVWIVGFSLLATALPVSSKPTADASSSLFSFSTQVYRKMRTAAATAGEWVSLSLLTRDTNRAAYHPVAYYGPTFAVIAAPTNFAVTSTSSVSIRLSWSPPAGTVDYYQIERSQSISGPFLPHASISGTSTYTDSNVTSLTSYLYRVRAVSSSGASTPSNVAMGTAVSFQLLELDGQRISAQHLYDVRAAANSVRALANLAPATWSRQTLSGLEVRASDILEIRTALNQALDQLGIASPAYEDSVLTVGATGTVIKASHIEQLQLASTRGTSNSFGSPDSSISIAKLDPLNEIGGGGENPLSRNFNWTLPLVSLPGRAELNLSLALSYNSLVWTRTGNSILFDSDNGFPGPGFRLGFPTIHPLHFNPEVSKYGFLILSADGSRTELRQVGTSSLFEAADSSHLLFDSSTMILRTADGTELTYAQTGNEYNCVQIKDRNGNYLTINYTAFGRIETVVDTLARQIKFNYDANSWLTSITQLWNKGAASQVTHNWATFSYAEIAMQTNFSGLVVNGPANGTKLRTLAKVTLADGSHYDFSYTTWGQIWKVSSFAADNHLLNYRSYNLPQTASLAHTDCPRFTERRDWAQYWNGDTNGTIATNEEAVTTFAIPASDTWTMPDGTRPTGMRAQVTTPDGVSNKIYFIGQAGTSTGWQRGLPALVNTYDKSGALQRQSTTSWTQNDTSVSYPVNPRVAETNIFDPAGNRSRVQLTYQKLTFANGTSCHLPRDVYEYAANATSILRSTRTEYNTSKTYTNRRILGLVSEKQLFEGDVNNGGTLLSKIAFNYDEAGSISGVETPVQHDTIAYGSSFVAGRGNLSSIKRYDVTNTAQFTIDSSKYNIAGSPVSAKDALNHETKISYADVFSDGNSTRNTFAYPTMLTDPDGYTTRITYSYDFGAETRTQTPQPNTTAKLPGPEQAFSFDSIGRLQQITNLVNNAYTRFEYPSNNLRIDTYTTIQEGQGEAHSFKIIDGHGRVVAAATDHPGIEGRLSAQRFVYDVIGRVIQTSNPTETYALGLPSEWEATGDDAEAGWIFATQTYDWKGRPLVKTNQDGSTRTVSYVGCGCAGGEVVTLTDEGTIDGGVAKRRQQKIYSDVLGRPVKSEVLNWQGGSVYSATVTSYNARDQVTQIREYAGPGTSSTYQDTISSYDGYGRLKTRHVPEQNTGTNTVWSYNADDTVQSVTDARGSKATYGYNARHMLTSKSYSAPAGITPAAPVTFAYDGAGNRTLMTDGLGETSYNYDQLSQMLSETRTFSGVGSYPITYQYNLGGQLSSITNPFNNTISYSRDKIGRLSGVTGTTFGTFMPISIYASNIQYRAWGGIKHLDYGDNQSLDATYNSRMLAATFSISGWISKSYQYHPDGQLRFSSDLLDHRFDRSYGFDHVGRITSAFSGAEARGEAATTLRPYYQTYSYDSLNHLTEQRIKVWWNSDATAFDNYTNNRRTGWQYDPDGRLLDDTRAVSSHDAAGRNIKIETSASTAAIGLDGDGRQIKTEETGWDEGAQSVMTDTKYFVRSNVLGGKVLTEFRDNNNYRSFVYTGSTVFAWQGRTFSSEVVDFERRDPSGASVRVGGSQQELDPFGGDAGISGTTEIPDEGSLLPYGSSYNAADPTASYSVDGLRVTKDDFIRRLGHVAKDPTTLLEIMVRQQAEKKLINYDVPMRNGGLKDVGLDYEKAVGEAYEEMTYTVIKNWLEDDSSISQALGLFQEPQKPTSESLKIPERLNPSREIPNVAEDLLEHIKKVHACVAPHTAKYKEEISKHVFFPKQTHAKAGVKFAIGAAAAYLFKNPIPLAAGAVAALEEYGERLVESSAELAKIAQTYIDARIACGAYPAPVAGEPGYEDITPKSIP